MIAVLCSRKAVEENKDKLYTKYLSQVKNTTKSLKVKGYLIALKQKSHAIRISNYYIIISYMKNALADYTL